MAKADIVNNHSNLYPPIKAMVAAIGKTIELAPPSLQPAIKMAVAGEVLNLEQTNEAREIVASLYTCFTCDEKKKGGK